MAGAAVRPAHSRSRHPVAFGKCDFCCWCQCQHHGPTAGTLPAPTARNERAKCSRSFFFRRAVLTRAIPRRHSYSVRSHSWRYTVWLPSATNKHDSSLPALTSNWTATDTCRPLPRFSELYDHRGDDGTDFDWAGNNENVVCPALLRSWVVFKVPPKLE